MNKVYKGGEVLDTIVLSWAGLVELSSQSWLDFGFVGIWITTVSLITLVHQKRRYLSVLGLVAGMCFIMTVVGNVTGVSVLVTIRMGLGGLVVVPIRFISFGFILIKNNKRHDVTSIKE
jgi:hypothetical protein